MNKLYVFSGASGVGKSTVLKQVMEGREDLFFSVSATTRAARPGEVDGVNYDTPDKADTEAGWGQIVITDGTNGTHTEFCVELDIRKKEKL